MQGLGSEVNKFLKSFEPHAFLWQKDLVSEYAAFLATNPDLEVKLSLSSAWLESFLCHADKMVQ